MLNFLSVVYSIIYYCWFFFKQQIKPYKASIPIISVGNLTVGGTGKTPFVSWLLDFLKSQGFSPIVLTRGYKSKVKTIRLLTNIKQKLEQVAFYGDESSMLSLQHPKTPIVIYHKRKISLQKYSHLGDIAVLDDGMQHLALSRDLDIGLINSLVGFGNKKMLPAGILREPLSALNRNDLILLTYSNLQKDKNFIKTIIQDLPSSKPIFQLTIATNQLIDSKTLRKTAINNFKNTNIGIFCALANPSSFLKTVQQFVGKNIEIKNQLYFRDHFQYDKKSLSKIFDSKKNPKTVFITTEKDWIKIIQFRKSLPKFFILKTNLVASLNFKQELQNRLNRLKKNNEK